MAHRLYKRGRIWWCWGISHGQRWHESTRCTDQQAAKQVQRDVERRRAAHDPAAQPLGLEHAINDAIAHRERLGRAVNTLKNWRQSGGHLCRILGHETDTHALDLVGLESYYDRRRKERASPHTIALELRILRAALAHAQKRSGYRGSIEAIWPSDLVRDVYRPRDRWLTPTEYRTLWLAIPAERRDYLTAYVYTGARRRELGAIMPSDVYLIRDEMRIPGTKTKRADRVVPLHAELRPIVERRLASCGDGPVWPEWTMVTHDLVRATSRSNMPHVVCTDFRRTFCSWLAQAGVPMLATARLMGHGSTKMIERVYAQLAPQTLADAIARLPTVTHASRNSGTQPHSADAVDDTGTANPAETNK
jgi:integrase